MPIRDQIMTALETSGKEGVSIDQIIELLGRDLDRKNPRQAVAVSIYSLRSKGLASEFEPGMWRLSQFDEEQPPPPGEYSKINAYQRRDVDTDARPAQAEWEGQRVVLYYEPRELRGTVTVKVAYWDNPEKWHPIGLFTDLRVYIGKGVPEWSPRRQVLRNVKFLLVEYKNPKDPSRNRQEEFEVSKTCLVTFDLLPPDYGLTDR